MRRWREVLILYRREVVSALRERTIVVNSILVPIFLYPFLLWVMFTGITFVQGQSENLTSRVLVASWPPDRSGLERQLGNAEKLQLVAPSPRSTDGLARIREGALDALVEFHETRAGSPAGNFRAVITVDGSKERSAMAYERVAAAIDDYREAWLAREAASHDVAPAAWEAFAVERRNVASGRQMGRFILGRMLPLFFVIMVAVGSFYPAVDATAGERERGTWETLMSTAASRVSIVTAKYLYVATFGCLAGALNLAAIMLTVRPVLAPLLERSGERIEFSVPLAVVPVMGLAAVLLASFVAAGMLMFAAFARSFREGQSMITPFYMLILLPVMFLQSPGIEFSVGLAMVPVVNVTLMVREAVSGAFPVVPIGVTMAVSLAVVAAAVKAASIILRYEDVVMGSYAGSLGSFARDRLRQRRPGARSEGRT